jgi:acid phosphatase type 7
MLRTRLSALAVLAVANCAGRDALRAEHTGDVSNPPAVRESADAALIEACGAGVIGELGAARVRRRPYLQQVTSDGATVVWTSRSTTPSWVEVDDAEGATLVVRAERDASANPIGAEQMVARVEGLRADTLHCYSVHDEDGELVGAAGFRTAPPANAPSTVRFVAFGDSGDGGFLQGSLREQMRTVPFDLALLLGDIAYEDGARAELETNFFGVYQALARSFPVYPVAGNHDYATEAAAPLREFFVLPENGGAEGRERWYSFDRGPVHFVGLDTERIGPAQAAWLDADLGATHRPWTVVFAHRPPFSSGYHGNDLAFQVSFLPVLRRHQPALVLAGHDHHYERFAPLDGTRYLVSGGGGRETRDVDWSERTEFAEPVIHFLYITADPEQLAVHAIDGTGREFDSLLLRR